MDKRITITTKVIKRLDIKLPHELASHPNINEAIVEIRENHITFSLPPKPGEEFAEIWQYIHDKQAWVVAVFTR